MAKLRRRLTKEIIENLTNTYQNYKKVNTMDFKGHNVHIFVQEEIYLDSNKYFFALLFKFLT